MPRCCLSRCATADATIDFGMLLGAILKPLVMPICVHGPLCFAVRCAALIRAPSPAPAPALSLLQSRATFQKRYDKKSAMESDYYKSSKVYLQEA